MSEHPGVNPMTPLQAAIFFLEVAVLENVCQPTSERRALVQRRCEAAQRRWKAIRLEARGKPRYFSAGYIRRFDRRFNRTVSGLLKHAIGADTPRVDWDRLSGDQMIGVTEAYEIHRRQLRRSALNLMSDAHDYEEQLEAARTNDNSDPQAERQKRQKLPRRRKRGRPPADGEAAKPDRKIAEAWATGQYKTHADLGRSLGRSERDVKLALDRHRKRLASKHR